MRSSNTLANSLRPTEPSPRWVDHGQQQQQQQQQAMRHTGSLILVSCTILRQSISTGRMLRVYVCLCVPLATDCQMFTSFACIARLEVCHNRFSIWLHRSRLLYPYHHLSAMRESTDTQLYDDTVQFPCKPDVTYRYCAPGGRGRRLYPKQIPPKFRNTHAHSLPRFMKT